MQIGKFYMSDQHHLCLYPDKKSAVEVEEESGYNHPYFWSQKLGKPVDYIKKCVPFLVLHKDRTIVEVLVGERKGFILYRKWIIFKELI